MQRRRGRRWRRRRSRLCRRLRGLGGSAGALLQLLEFFDVARQLGHPRRSVFLLGVLRSLGFGAAGARLDRALRQGQLVRGRRGGLLAIVDRCLHLAGGLARALAGRRRRHVARQGLAVLAEVRALRANGFLRVGGGDRVGLLRRRHVQHGAGLEPVHVVADEGVRVVAEQRDQHLVERHVGALVALGDAVQRVAFLDLVFALAARRAGRCDRRRSLHRAASGRRCGARRRRSLRRSRRGARARCGLCRRRWLRCSRDLRRGGRLRHHRRRHARLRRIEQQRVFAHQSAGRPRELEDHVDERLLHRAIALHAQIRPSIGPTRQRDRGRRQHGVVFDARRAIRVGGRDANAQAGVFLGAEAGDVDLGAKRFAECGLNVEAAEAQGPSATRGSDHRGQRDGVQRDASSVSRAVFQGVSQVQPAREQQARRRSQVVQLERFTSVAGNSSKPQ